MRGRGIRREKRGGVRCPGSVCGMRGCDVQPHAHARHGGSVPMAHGGAVAAQQGTVGLAGREQCGGYTRMSLRSTTMHAYTRTHAGTQVRWRGGVR